jgi:SAM-dependent methyltransferase
MHATKLNLGCGDRKRDGYLNVDVSPECAPDEVVDLESLPWPFEDDSADEILMSHVLEHLGADSRTFLGIIQELYRVCRHDAVVHVIVPHPRHDDFLIDPTHVRPILPETFQLFSKARNITWRQKGAANTPLALILDVDFEIARVNYTIDEPWLTLLGSGELDRDGLELAIRQHFNVVKQIEVDLKVIKA